MFPQNSLYWVYIGTKEVLCVFDWHQMQKVHSPTYWTVISLRYGSQIKSEANPIRIDQTLHSRKVGKFICEIFFLIPMMLACMNSCLDFKNITKKKEWSNPIVSIGWYDVLQLLAKQIHWANILYLYTSCTHVLYFVSLFFADYHSLSLQGAELQNNANLN